MKEFFKDIRNDKLTFRAFVSALVLILIPLPYILFFYGSLPPYIPVLNQLAWGQPRVISTWGIFLPSIISLVILGINLVVSSYLYKNVPLISRMLAGISLLIAILTILFVFRTIQIVI
jgi:hypothetical protein